MKRFIFRTFAAIAIVAISPAFYSCSSDDPDNPDDPTASQQFKNNEKTLQTYVDDVVVPTYRELADAAILLADACNDLSSQEKVNNACQHWLDARRYWELSEAFLFGAAADYNIDPHIDSWPLDLGQLDAVLKAGDISARIEAGTAGYGKRLEGIEIVLVEKNGKAPGDTANAFKEKQD